jgi:hypothetical protein
MAQDLLRTMGTQMHELREETMIKGIPLKFPLALALWFAAFSQAGAGIYYVDANDSGASDTGPGTASQPWKTISKANQTLVAGDTVYIRAGTYSQGVAPAKSGTAVSNITYAAYPGESVLITGGVVGIALTARNWIIVSGINFKNIGTFGNILGSSYNTITNCVFDVQTGGSYTGLDFENNGSGGACSYSNLVTHCTLGHCGNIAGNTGDMINVGDESDSTDTSGFNVIDSCTLYSAGHSLINFRTGRNVLRNSWLHNEAWDNGWGQRCLLTLSYFAPTTPYGGNNLIENNSFTFAAPYTSGNNSAGFDLRTDRNIVRRNAFYNNTDSGIILSDGSNPSITHSYPLLNRIYQNTFYSNGTASGGEKCAIVFTSYGGLPNTSNYVVNNVFNKQPSTFLGSTSSQILKSNWLDTAASPQFADVTNAYTATSVHQPDLSLKANSPCIDNGAWLTTATSSGSGTSLPVADAGYFFQGVGALLPGDRIQLEGSSGTAQITAITGNTLTLDKGLTWTNGQGIALPYNGSRPDIGAYEFGATGMKPTAPANLRVVGGP